MVDVISNIISDKQDIKSQLGDVPTVIPALKKFTNTFNVKNVVTKQIERSIAGSMIWGSESHGVWGTSSWGSTAGSSFILNSPSYGVLGTNALGAGGTSDTLYSVIPTNNIYVEYFGQDDYINTENSTGTLDSVNETYTLDIGEILESKVIAKLREPITNVTVYDNIAFLDVGGGMVLGSLALGSTQFGANTVTIEMSNDGGLTWFGVDEGVKYTFSVSTPNDELKYRITSLSGQVIINEPISVAVNQ